MKVFFWYLAKGIQASAMMVVAYALIVGIESSDPYTELQWLMVGVVMFMAGLGFERVTGGGSE